MIFRLSLGYKGINYILRSTFFGGIIREKAYWMCHYGDAINAVNLANFLVNTRKISFDLIVKTMHETGIDLLSHYRETSTGGMAKLYPIEKEE